MKITKTNEEVVYTRTTTDHTFTINDKEIVIREYSTSECDEIQNATIESGYDELTDEELEAVGEEMNELIYLKVNEELITEDYN